MTIIRCSRSGDVDMKRLPAGRIRTWFDYLFGRSAKADDLPGDGDRAEHEARLRGGARNKALVRIEDEISGIQQSRESYHWIGIGYY